MFTALLLLSSLLGPVAFVSAVHGEPTLKSACTSWNQWKTSLQSDPEVQLTCNINTYCTGIGCSGKYQDYKLDLELLMHHCADPVSVEFRLSVPRLNVRDWNHTFVHGDRFPLPSEGSLEVFLQQKDEETVVFGCSLLKSSSAGSGKDARILTIRNKTIKLPPCRKGQDGGAKGGKLQRAANGQSREYPALLRNTMSKQETGGKPCNLDELRGCGEHQMCEEVRHSNPPQAACICLPDFHWYNNNDLACVPIVPSPASDGAATNGTGNGPSSNPTPLMTSVQIAVPLVLIALTATLVVLAYKFRWVSKLRARLRRPSARVYEEMIIDGEEASSIHSLTADPVA